MIDKDTLRKKVYIAFMMGYDIDEPIDAILEVCNNPKLPEFLLIEEAYKLGHAAYVENQISGFRNPEFYFRDFLIDKKLI